MKRWVSISEMRKLLGAVMSSPPALRTIQRWCEEGMVPATKLLGGQWQVDLRALKSSSVEAGEVYEEIVRSVNEELA